jgi:hypothetical protein
VQREFLDLPIAFLLHWGRTSHSFPYQLDMEGDTMFGHKKIQRVGRNRSGEKVEEIKIATLHPIHPTPRRGVHEGFISGLAEMMATYGYDVRYPVETYRMPNNDLVVVGGHHRIEAMKLLKEKTIPVVVRDWSQADPINLAWNLGIGEVTGYYGGYFEPFLERLNPDQQAYVHDLLTKWVEKNL